MSKFNPTCKQGINGRVRCINIMMPFLSQISREITVIYVMITNSLLQFKCCWRQVIQTVKKSLKLMKNYDDVTCSSCDVSSTDDDVACCCSTANVVSWTKRTMWRLCVAMICADFHRRASVLILTMEIEKRLFVVEILTLTWDINANTSDFMPF